jgi:predicted small secreted protein
MVNPEDSVGENAGWIITDLATGEILGLPEAGPFDLNGAGVGTCQIWYLRYEDGLLGKEVGNNLEDLEGCFDLSNPLDVIREEADGGTVAIDLEATGNPNGTTTFNGDTEAVICVDGQMDPIVVIHENDSPNLSYRYVITDAATGLILNVVATNSINLDPAGPGTCEIWGWSYRGVPNNGLDDLDCSDISDNAITVIREEADGGTVSIDIDATEAAGGSAIINSDTEAVICLDAEADPIVVAHINDAPNLSYRYVITDAATGLILNVVNTNSIDLNGVEAGTCEIWGWSYRGVPGNGLDQVGQPLSSLDDLDCSDISDNAVTVIRQEADLDSVISIDIDATGNPNGTTTFTNEFEAIICGDSQADPLVIAVESVSNDLPYTLIAYDFDTSLITNVIDVEGASATLDLNGSDNALFEIFGVSGIVPISTSDLIGTNVFDFFGLVNESECLEFSISSIFVVREVANGGTVAIDIDNTDTSNGTTVITDELNVTIVAGDGIPDPIVVVHENDAPNLSYRYVITDAETGLILNVVNTNIIDLDEAGTGTCEIWGWSYRGVPGNGLEQVGLPLSSLDDLDCSDISDNAITVVRDEVLSTEDAVLDIDLRVFPNPTTDVLNISVGGSNNGYSTTIYSLTGSVVSQQTFSGESNSLNVANYAAGVYLIEIVDSETNTRTIKRFIKR